MHEWIVNLGYAVLAFFQSINTDNLLTSLSIMGIGMLSIFIVTGVFILDSMVGVLFVKVLNIFTPGNKINPMVGAAGISAFPMSARVVHKLGLEEDSSNFLLLHSIGVNVSGQIASVIAGGLILALVKGLLGL